MLSTHVVICKDKQYSKHVSGVGESDKKSFGAFLGALAFFQWRYVPCPKFLDRFFLGLHCGDISEGSYKRS